MILEQCDNLNHYCKLFLHFKPKNKTLTQDIIFYIPFWYWPPRLQDGYILTYYSLILAKNTYKCKENISLIKKSN